MVQVRLLPGEHVQVVLAQLLVEFPGAAAEKAVPVVGLLPRPVVAAAGRAPEVVVVMWVAFVAAAGEPLVLRGGVVDHQVHDDAHPALVGAVEHLFEYLQVAVFRVYAAVVGDVIAVVEVRRGIERREPDGVHTQALDIVEPGIYAPEVAYAVAVPVTEAARPYLIDDHVLVPVAVFHAYHSSVIYTSSISECGGKSKYKYLPSRLQPRRKQYMLYSGAGR